MAKKYPKEVKLEIGFIPEVWVYKNGVRIFKKVELIEVSQVGPQDKKMEVLINGNE